MNLAKTPEHSKLFFKNRPAYAGIHILRLSIAVLTKVGIQNFKDRFLRGSLTLALVFVFVSHYRITGSSSKKQRAPERFAPDVETVLFEFETNAPASAP